MPTLPVLPLKNLVIFPDLMSPIAVGRQASLRAVKKARDDSDRIITVLQKNSDDEEPNLDALYDVGTVCQITRVEGREGGAQEARECVPAESARLRRPME